MIAIYCSRTLDGILSSAIVLRYAMLKRLCAKFESAIVQSDMAIELDNIAKQKGKLIFFLDLPVEEEHLDALDRIGEHNKIAYWSGPQNSIKPKASLCESENRMSAAELAARRFLPKDKIAKRLAILAHDYKFWQLKESESSKLADIIAYGYPPSTLAEQLSKGIVLNDSAKRFYELHNARKKEILSNIKKTLSIKPILSYRIGYAISTEPIASAQACENILSTHSGMDAICLIESSGKFTLRCREDCTLDMSSLAKIFGGGGQRLAAGGHIRERANLKNYSIIIQKVNRAFRESVSQTTHNI